MSSETVVIAKCVGCGETKEVREGEYGSGELPMCDRCYSPMFAHEARTQEVPDDQTTYDLHGTTAGEVTEDFDDEIGYLERVTVTNQALAEEKFCEAWRVDPEEIDVQPIHMRWVTEDPDPIVVPDLPCWLECEADHPDAVPFWAVKP